MRLHVLRDFALVLPQTTVTKQWGENLVFKVGPKMFLIIALDGDVPESISFKCSVADFRRLTDVDGIIPAPYLTRASWVQLQDPAVLPIEAVQAQIRASYELVKVSLPKASRRQGTPPPSQPR